MQRPTNESSKRILRVFFQGKYTEEMLEKIHDGTLFPGDSVTKEIFSVFYEYLNIRPVYIGPYKPNFPLGKPDVNGTWNGIFGEIVRGNVDISSQLVLSQERYEAVEFAYIIETFAYSALSIERPKFATEDLMHCLHEFQWQIWCALACTLFGVCICVSLIMRSEMPYRRSLTNRPYSHKVTATSQTFFYILQRNVSLLVGALLKQGFKSANSKSASRFAVLAFLIGTFILGGIFSSTITTNSLVPAKGDVIDYFDKLLYTNNRCPILQANVALARMLEESPAGTFENRLWSRVKECERMRPDVKFLESDERFINAILENKVIPVHVALMVNRVGKIICNKDPTVHLHFSKEKIFPVSMSIPMNKGLDPLLKKQINRKLSQLKSSGIYAHWTKQMDDNVCLLDPVTNNYEMLPAKIGTLKNLFISWLVGTLTSWSILVGELLADKFTKRTQQRQNGGRRNTYAAKLDKMFSQGFSILAVECSSSAQQ